MKIITIISSAVFMFSVVGCHTTDNANGKLEECIEDEFGEEAVDERMGAWEIDCEDGEEACDECVDCVLDNECEDIMAGECADLCP